MTLDARPTDAWVFLLPPGWARFPVGEGRERELDEAIESVVVRALPADLPRDTAEPYRRLLRERLHQGIAAAGAEGANAVYLPYDTFEGVVLPCSLVELELTTDAGTDPREIVSSVLADGYEDSEAVEVDGRPGVRVVSTLHEVEQDDDLPMVSSRQVLYGLNRDEDAGEWLVLSFHVVWTTAETERLADTLVLFFDALMGTFRWAGPGAQPGAASPGGSVPGSAPAPGPVADDA
ncbi:hypothetical protein [Antribacter gilvus]|uniref:hypothetical protein n=1 Tax=Antribacter gilvus TaxID=2304675 RepID=UPI00197DF603|nr:hypothetical protein [Antribacter gilvus]